MGIVGGKGLSMPAELSALSILNFTVYCKGPYNLTTLENQLSWTLFFFGEFFHGVATNFTQFELLCTEQYLQRLSSVPLERL